MKTLIFALAASALVAGAAGSASADSRGHNDQGSNQQHAGWAQDQGASHQWQRGQRMGYNDWSSAQPVDYRQHHLRAPARGYQWRQANGQYVLAAATTGLIASIIMANGH